MRQRLTNKAEIARLAGVTGGAVTRACKAALKPAMVGNRVDLNHEAAQDYIKKHASGTPKKKPIGVDRLAAKAFKTCLAADTWSAVFIRAALGVPERRARNLAAIIKTTPGYKNRAAVLAEIPIVKAPHIRGTKKARNDKKSTSLQALAAKVEPPEKKTETETGSIIHEVPDDIQAFADMTLRELIERFGSDVAFCDWLKAVKSIEEINEKRLKNAATRGDLVSRKLIKQGIIDPVNGAHTRLLTDVKKTLSIRVVAMAAAGAEQDKIEEFIADQITSVLRPIKKKVSVTMAAI